MPTLGDACGVIARMFDVSAWGGLYLPEKTNVLFIVMGVLLLAVKDLSDEYRPEGLRLMCGRRRALRWCTYISLAVLIMLTGVFDAGQFIYANF